MDSNDLIKNRLREIAYGAYCKKDEIEEIGLINGKMGLCINLYHLAKFIHDDDLMENADRFLDEIHGKIDMSLPIYFSNGLTGIGWGIQHLISQSFVHGEADGVLQDIDILETEVVKFFPVREFGFLTGFIGQLVYIIGRLKGRCDSENKVVLQLQVTLISLIERLDHIVKYEDSLFTIPAKSTVYWDLPIVAWILAELREMGIYKSRVERIRAVFVEKMSTVKMEENLYGLMLRHSFLSLSCLDLSVGKSIESSSLLSDMNGLLHAVQWHFRLSKLNREHGNSFFDRKNDFVSTFLLCPAEDFISVLTDGYGGFYQILKHL